MNVLIKYLAQEIRVEIRIIHNWRDEMSNRTTPEYQLLAGNIEDAIRNELNADLNFITSAVLKLKYVYVCSLWWRIL